jgi:hypothetical protein
MLLHMNMNCTCVERYVRMLEEQWDRSIDCANSIAILLHKICANELNDNSDDDEVSKEFFVLQIQGGDLAMKMYSSLDQLDDTGD